MQLSDEPIAKKLKHFREARNLTIKEVSKEIGIPESTYREWEYGRAIRGEPYVKIAKAFDITLEELLGAPKSQDSYEKELDKIIDEVSKLKDKLLSLKNKKFLFFLFSLFGSTGTLT